MVIFFPCKSFYFYFYEIENISLFPYCYRMLSHSLEYLYFSGYRWIHSFFKNSIYTYPFLTFTSLLHLEFFLYYVRNGLNFIFFLQGSPFTSMLLFTRLKFHWFERPPLLYAKFTYAHDIFLNFLFCSIGFFVLSYVNIKMF